MKKLMLVINPAAGRGGYKFNLPEALQLLDQGGYRTTLFFTAARKDATEFVRDQGQNYDVVACIGGDGTLSEVITGLMSLENPPKLAYLPMGTANDVATTLGLPKNDTLAAARRLLSGTPHPFDVGGFGDDQYFAYIAAFGAFTEVSYGTPQETKQALGHLAYMLEGIRSLTKIADYHAIVEYDGGVLEDDFIFGAVTNSTSVAGMVRLDAERVNLSDGMFEVLLVRKPADLLALSDIIGSVLSMDFSGPNVLFLKSSEVRFMFRENVAWTRDGEDGGSHRDVYIVNRHPGVDIIA